MSRRATRRAPAPWTPEEEAKLCQMVSCGLCVDHYARELPTRRFGEILERRLELVEAGRVSHPRAL